MKLVIMGAGYVGTALLKSLKDSSNEVYITTTQQTRVDELKEFGLQVCVLHPNEEKELKKLLQTCDGMIILVAPKNAQTYEEVYLNTAKRIYSALEHRETPFYLLYTSSTSVYEGFENVCLTEDILPNPKSQNAKMLFDAEKCYLNSNVETCILRLGGIYGPKRDIIDRAKRFSGKEMPSAGDEATNHIHLYDIVRGILHCLNYRLTGVFHLVNDDHPSRKELYKKFCHLAMIPSPLWNSAETPQSKQTGYKISNQKIKDAGFVFEHPFINDSPWK